MTIFIASRAPLERRAQDPIVRGQCRATLAIALCDPHRVAGEGESTGAGDDLSVEREVGVMTEEKTKRPLNCVIRKTAREIYQIKGAIEIDDNSIVSAGDAAGTYVQAWVWVDWSDVKPEDSTQ